MPASLASKPDVPRQKPGTTRRDEIISATLDAIADHGVSKITHRLVAKYADVPSSSVTYYFGPLENLIFASYEALLRGAIYTLNHIIKEMQARNRRVTARDLMMYVLLVVTSRYRKQMIAGFEIVLDASYRQKMYELTQKWYAEVLEAWKRIGFLIKVEDAPRFARIIIDMVIGLLLISISLNVGRKGIREVFKGDHNVLRHWASPQRLPPKPNPRIRSNAQDTYASILDAAVELMIDLGPSGVTYASVAERINMTSAALVYHFPTIDSLLSEAQRALFELSKARYRRGMGGVSFHELDIDLLIDLTSRIFAREATEFAGSNLASNSVWLCATRQQELRARVWSAVEDLYRSWDYLLLNAGHMVTPLEPLFMEALVLGKTLRIATTDESSSQKLIRTEFAEDFQSILHEPTWL